MSKKGELGTRAKRLVCSSALDAKTDHSQLQLAHTKPGRALAVSTQPTPTMTTAEAAGSAAASFPAAPSRGTDSFGTSLRA